jgi:hypothetical protein
MGAIAMTNKSITCQHKNFIAEVAVNRFQDTGRFAADVRVRCKDCGEPFRFLGVEPGISHRKPGVSIDGLELRAPIEPEGTKRLYTRSTFEVPPKETTT